MDFTVAATVLLLAAPVFVVLILLIRTKLGTPVFFRQRRIGRNGVPFDILKFRTMTDARDTTGAPLPDAERLPPFGQWLRATSLDELPELWNILTGRMSLIGPRPLLPEYMPYYTETEQLRHTVRPGITGLAQVSGRNGLSWDARLALDVQYVKRMSLLGDLRILWRTVKVVLKREGISASGHATMRRLDEVRAAASQEKP